MGSSLSYGEAAALIRELAKEWGSHYQASLNEWAFVMSYGEWASILHLESYAEVHRDRKKVKQPWDAPKPWRRADAAPTVTDAERADLVEQLERRSVFAD